MLISIIVPVYNTEKYLDECIQSILNQTYSNFELLLINDGSSDRSGEICDKYALKDDRIKVFHQKNAGVSAARNLGLEHAKGEWVTFVDSDDYIGQNYLLDFIKLEIYEDLIYQNTIKFNDFNKEKLYTFKNETMSIKKFIEDNMITSYGYVHSKFFKSKIIIDNNLRFDVELSFAEDSIFILSFLNYSNNIYFSEIANYYYRDTPNSLVKQSYSYDKELYLLNQAKHNLYEIVNKKNLVIDNRLLDKELQYYMFRVLKSNSKISNKSIRLKNLEFLLTNYKNELLYVYKNAKGRGLLIYYCIKMANRGILDALLNKILL